MVLGKVNIKENRLGSGERRENVMEGSRIDTNIWTLRSVKRKFKSIDERLFRLEVTSTLRYMNDCFVEQALGNRQTELLNAPTENYDSFEHAE